MTVKVTRTEHHMYKGWRDYQREWMDKALPPDLKRFNRPLIGRWHYHYESEKGKISLIELPNYFDDGVDLWEICGAMTPDGDIERFGSKKEAERRIYELLEERKQDDSNDD